MSVVNDFQANGRRVDCRVFAKAVELLNERRRIGRVVLTDTEVRPCRRYDAESH